MKPNKEPFQIYNYFSLLFLSKKLQNFGTKKPNKEPCQIYTSFFLKISNFFLLFLIKKLQILCQ